MIIGVLCWSLNANADVFKTSIASENKSIVDARNQNTEGNYYRGGMDYPLTSDLNRQTYDLGRGTQGVLPNGYGSFDLNESIKSYLNNKKELRDITSISKEFQLNERNYSSLMLLQYSSPAIADLFKHFHIAALLKMGIRATQYADLHNSVSDRISTYIARSEFLCINEQLKKRSSDSLPNRKSLDEASQYCREQKVFASLVNNSQKILESALNTVSTPINTRTFMLTVLGDATITQDDYVFKGPSERIGDVLEKNRKEFLTSIKALVKGYKTNHAIDENDLKELVLPGIEVEVYQIRNLALLNNDKGVVAVAHLASRLAYIKTLQDYARADEYLHRILESPNVDAVYKPFIEERRIFLNDEIKTLKSQKEMMEEYSQSSVSLLEQADLERLKTITRMTTP